LQGTLDSLEVLDARQFQIVVRRLADSLSHGTDHSRFLGSGVEYVQSRPYQPGDPVRSIDWRVTARSGRVFVKEYESPKRTPVYMLVDTSASMTISSTARSKYATAVFLAGGLALACLDRVSPVGVIAVGSRGLHVRPSLSKNQIMQWLLELKGYRFDETTQLGARVAELTPSLSEKTLFFVLSDLQDPGSLGALKQLAARHDCAVLQLQDPAEATLRGAGLMRAREAETGRVFATHGRRTYHDQETLEGELRRGGLDHLLVRTDADYVHALRHFVESRGLLGRGAR